MAEINQETAMIVIVIAMAVGICLAGWFVWTPMCKCGHRACWHNPDCPTGCLKCDCKEFERHGK